MYARRKTYEMSDADFVLISLMICGMAQAPSSVPPMAPMIFLVCSSGGMGVPCGLEADVWDFAPPGTRCKPQGGPCTGARRPSCTYSESVKTPGQGLRDGNKRI